MSKRRTAGVQRRTRATDAALNQRLGVRGRRPWLLWGFGAFLAVGAIAVVLLAVSGTPAVIGVRQPNAGAGHVAVGSPGGPFTSVPATSGTHWDQPGNWGVYTTASPMAEAQSVHNLEHGGVVVWYQPSRLTAAAIQQLTSYVQAQASAQRYKIILSPWTGKDFGHPIAVTAWDWLLYLDTPNLDSIRQFVDAHYGKSPEPLGGPGPPAAP